MRDIPTTLSHRASNFGFVLLVKTMHILLFSFLFLVISVSGMSYTISPENPVAGDEITIKGRADQNQDIWPSISFEKTVSVSNGKYEYKFNGVIIPSGENKFTLTADYVKNLYVRTKIWQIPFNLFANASGGKAIVSQANVPKGDYDIRMDGDSADSASSVPLKITASSKITADAQGNFVYKYSTSGVPPGTFTLNIGGITRTLSLSEPRTAQSPTSSSGGGGGGGGMSGENYSNIEIKEKKDLFIFKDKVTSYKFTNQSNPITSVNITGNVNAGEVNVAVEILKKPSTLLKVPAPGNVYKNINIWVGNSGFTVPKNIKESVIYFRVANAWIEDNKLSNNDIKILRWNGLVWIQLEKAEKSKDSSYTFYEAKTDLFSSFAISGIKDKELSSPPSVMSPINSSEPSATSTRITATATTTSTPVEIPGFEVIIAVIALMGAWRKKT